MSTGDNQSETEIADERDSEGMEAGAEASDSERAKVSNSTQIAVILIPPPLQKMRDTEGKKEGRGIEGNTKEGLAQENIEEFLMTTYRIFS